MELVFILVEPQVPENVGAACRALKTMGFSRLRVVNSVAHLEKPASWLAHGSSDLLNAIERFDSLAEAVADLDLVAGTSAKPRGRLRTLLHPEQLRDQWVDQAGEILRCGLVFGREDRGLSNEELACCDQLTSIPLAVNYPSLNLGQAVMLYAYVLSGLQSVNFRTRPSKNTEGQRQVLKQRVVGLLQQLDHQEDNLGLWVQERLSALAGDDLQFMHSLCTTLEKKLK